MCPYNGTAPVSDEAAWQPRRAWDAVSVVELAGRTDEALRAAMRGSAMTRAGVKHLRRNIDVASANVRQKA